ncbi:MAG TPA: alpha/beta fold hydrolase [Dehalococcoidia bacterium]|jgi:pimeloyl-ACP methyl ester carboxylesterase|nr:alpha/beta fold hydrolase [Dehalococcoidia bacterium]
MVNNLQVPSHWIEIKGLKIHFKCLGEGPPVILLHGGGNDWREWRKNLIPLAQGLRIYAPDLPGFGLSDPPLMPVSPSWFSSFLKDFMEAVGVKEAHIIGHSLGGTLAIALALDFPQKVKKVVLIDSAGLGPISGKGRLFLFLLGGLKKVLGKENKPKFKPRSAKEWLLADRLAELRAKVMIVWGENDPYLPTSQAELAHQLIPDSELRIFPRCRHAPHRERSNEFNHLVYQFLTQ